MTWEWRWGEMTQPETSREQDPIMGRPSDKKRSAQRPGQRERKRVKKSRRGQLWTSVAGVWDFHAKVGQKKWHRVYVCLARMRADHAASVGKPISNAGTDEVLRASLKDSQGRTGPFPQETPEPATSPQSAAGTQEPGQSSAARRGVGRGSGESVG